MPSKLLKMSRLMRWWFIHMGPQRDVTIQTENGVLTVSSNDWLIGKHLYVRRGYEVNEMRTAVRLLRENRCLGEPGQGTVIDIGANIGTVCIGFLKHGDFKRAIAFEPTPESFRLLLHNIAQNGFSDRIKAFPLALSSRAGEMQLELSPNNSGDNRIRGATGPGDFREEKRRIINVAIDTLDHFLDGIDDLCDQQSTLVWLDIQGHEGHFFSGARRLLSRRIPVVSEFWPYAISRSGISRVQFNRIVSDLFTNFYVLGGDRHEKRPVSQLDALFDVYGGPKQMCLLALVHD